MVRTDIDSENVRKLRKYYVIRVVFATLPPSIVPAVLKTRTLSPSRPTERSLLKSGLMSMTTG